jgi:DUF4097 and DUF4098 domain-containing protein YvlB
MTDVPLTESQPLHVSTRSGKVRVTALPGAALEVSGGTVVHEEKGVLLVRRTPGASKIEIRCAAGSDVTIGTVSGSVECAGELGALRIATISGKVNVEHATSVDVRTKSGRVEVGACEGDCRIVVASAKVHIGRAGRAMVAAISGQVLAEDVGGAEVKTVSGKVFLETTGAGRVSVKTVSGGVEVRVPREIQPATRLRSISGKVQCDCPTGGDGEINVASVSGGIKVLCR